VTFDRADYRVRTHDGVGLRVRCVTVSATRSDAPVVVLVHGIAAPLEPTYDLPVPGYSFLEELAGRGYRAVAFDHRNFGLSDRDPAMQRDPTPDPEGRGLQTLDDSVADIQAVVRDSCERFQVQRAALFGSSRGAIQVLAYACAPDPDASIAILNNPSSLCYLAGASEGPARALLERERDQARRPQSYTPYTAEFQRARWQKLFGKDLAVDAALQEAYIASCIASDPEGSRRSPPIFRVPTESFPSRIPLVDLSALHVPLVVIEAEEIQQAHVETFRRCVGERPVALLHIRDSNHFTLRNARRFELANLLDLAIRMNGWKATST
jgi:alpha-beta hydrolase superfamily lysophospholipase